MNELCQSGTWGSDFYKINPLKNEKIIIKHRYDAFTNPELDECLKSNNTKNLLMIGCTTNVCVDSTARSGFMKGYYIVAVEDCLAATKNHKYTLNYMKECYNALVIKSKEIIDFWSKIK